MENKPIIILGGGIWGNLLVHRITTCLPEVKIRLCLPHNSLQGSGSWSFREKELSASALEWVRPFISYSWEEQKVVLGGVDRTLSLSRALVLPGQVEAVMRGKVKPERLGEDITFEDLLSEGSFVIDTRPDLRRASKCFRQTFGLMLELTAPHKLRSPLTVEVPPGEREVLRHLELFPLSPYVLLMKDVRYSKDRVFELDGRKAELLDYASSRWKVKEILHQESETLPIPSGKEPPWRGGRVVILSDILNPVTGDQFSEVVKVVDLMVGTSFRLGELQDVLRRYRRHRHRQKSLSRLFVKLLYHSPRQRQRRTLKFLLSLPEEALEKFLDGRLRVQDLGKVAFLGVCAPLFKLLGAPVTNKSTKLEELTPKAMIRS